MISSLFYPLNLGNRELKNRAIAAPPPSLLCSEEGTVTAELLSYYQNISQSGVSAVIVEGAAINPAAKSWPKHLDISATDALGGLSRLVEKIRHCGALPILQLYHGGINAFPTANSMVYGPSAVKLKGMRHEATALSKDQINQIIRDYVAGAIMAWNAGFSGIEIQAAEGSLLQQFLCPLVNKRTDQYSIKKNGGTSLLLEIVKLIKNATPDLFLIGKIAMKDLIPGGAGLHASIETAKLLKKEGVAMVHVTEGLIIGNPLKQHSALDKTAPASVFAEDSQILRHELKHPVILSGKIATPEIAESRLRREFCDLVSLGRTLNRNQYWLREAPLPTIKKTSPCRRCEICLYATQGCPDKLN